MILYFTTFKNGKKFAFHTGENGGWINYSFDGGFSGNTGLKFDGSSKVNFENQCLGFIETFRW